MALAFTNRVAFQSNTDATSYTTAAFTPSASAGILVAIYTSKASNPDLPSLDTPSWLDGSWTQEIDQSSPPTAVKRLTVFSGKTVASPGSDDLTVSYGATETGCIVIVTDVTGQNATDFVLQPAATAATAATSTSKTLAGALAAADSAIWSACGISINEVQAPAGGESEITEVGHTAPTSHLQTQFQINDTTSSVSWTTSSVSVIGALEVKASSGATHTGSAALAITLATGTAGYALKRSAVALPETLAVATAASQVKHATSSLPVAFGATTAGYTLKRALSALPLTLSIATAGAELPKFGSVSLELIAFGYGSGGFGGENYGSGVHGYAIKRAAVALPISLAVGTAGGRKAVGSAALPLTLAIATSGTAIAVKSGSASLAVAFGVATSGTKTTRSTVALPLTLAIATNGTFQAFVTGSAALPVTFGVATNAVRTTSSSLALPLTFAVATSAWTPRRGQASLVITFGVLTNTGVLALLGAIETGHIGYAGRGRIEGAERGEAVYEPSGVV